MSRPAGGSRSARRGVPSLRAQVAWVIAVLSGLPNLVLAATVMIPAYRRAGEMTSAVAWYVVLWLVGVVAVSAVVGYLLSGQLLAPLLDATRDIEALPRTASRLTSGRLAVSGREPAEVGALKATFNNLLAQVQVEQTRRSSFMAALMHDLKTPLVAANHLLAVVRDNEELSREQRIDVVSRLSTENEALIALVQKMVDAHRLERDDVPLTREDVDVAALASRVARRLALLAQQRGVRVEVHGAGHGRVDPKEVERALYNLMSNAVRYARSAIDVEVFPGMVRIGDDGPGLPEPLERLAQPFNGQPVDIAGQRFTAGTGGLGLFIARRVLEAHGGRLVTETTGERGTVLLAYLGREAG